MKWEILVETCKMHAKTQMYKKHVQHAVDVVNKAFKRSSKPYLAYSGGKDSTALLHLVIKYAPSHIAVYHWDFGVQYMPREFEEKIRENALKMGVKEYHVEMVPTVRSTLRTRADGPLFSTWLYEKMIPQLRSAGHDLVFLGLRSRESLTRKDKIGNRDFREDHGVVECYPLRKWTAMDVWTYIIVNNVPFLEDYYKKRVEAERNIESALMVRFTTLFDPYFEHLGGGESADGLPFWKYRSEHLKNE